MEKWDLIQIYFKIKTALYPLENAFSFVIARRTTKIIFFCVYHPGVFTKLNKINQFQSNTPFVFN